MQYTRLENKILEKLPTLKLSGLEYSLFLVVLRKTIGWRKDFDRISLTDLQSLTGGSSRKAVSKSLQTLVDMKILLKQEGKRPAYGINENLDEWVVTKRLLVAKRLPTSYQKATSMVTKRLPATAPKTKRTNQSQTPKETIKETNTKEIITGGQDLVNDFKKKLAEGMRMSEPKKSPQITHRYQELGNLWTEKFGLDPKNDRDQISRLYGLFKQYKNNMGYVERLAALALEANAKAPVWYMLSILGGDRKKI